MPRIIVTTDHPTASTIDGLPVLLSESVSSVHLSTDHAAGQLIERLAWAIKDAESAEVSGTAGARNMGKRERNVASVSDARGKRRDRPALVA